MRLLGAIGLTIALLVAPAGAGAAGASGLRGKVTLFPAHPVCAEDEPCTKPAPGALLVFRRNGLFAARITTTKDATYRVLLIPGVYTIVAPRYRIGSGVTPHTTRVPRSGIVRVDLQIDTGIQ